MKNRRRAPLAIFCVLLLVVAATVIGVLSDRTPPRAEEPTTTVGPPTSTQVVNPYAAIEAKNVAQAIDDVNVSLPSKTGAPAPVLPPKAYSRVLHPMQVVGFVPWYELANLHGLDLAGFTYLVYSGVDVSATGALVEKDNTNGWGDLVNGGASDLVSAGHSNGDRVLLSLFQTEESTIETLCSNGAANGAKLAGEVAPLLSEYGFDGIDIDVEGEDPADRAGMAAFVKAFSQHLKAKNASWALMVNTYPQSAEDSSDFFDVRSMAPYVDAIFVMGYDMNSSEITSPDAPLTGSDPSDAEALATYVAAGLGSKTILGVPFYGFDYPAMGPDPGDTAAANPYSVSYSAIVTSFTVNHHKPVWDPASDTAYTTFRRDSQWHQTWFDDPVSIALKVALASTFDVAGVGAWELGMAEGSPQMLTILAGGSAVKKFSLAR